MLSILGAAAIVGLLGACASGDQTPTASPSTTRTPTAPRPTPTSSPTPTVPAFNKAAHSVDDPASIWVVVNKARGLNPADYTPANLVKPDVTYVNHQPMRQETADGLVAMFAAGHAEAQLRFSVQSAYRSFQTQTSVYDADVAAHGQAYADTDTARPGHSEHQTGLAVDISAVPAACSLDACFGDTPHGRWLVANAWRFGFLLRYPADKVEVTGFTFEPWHFRFVGVELSTELHRIGVTTLEEFFALPGGTTYH